MKELENLLTFIREPEPDALLLRPTRRAGCEDGIPVWSCLLGLLCAVTNQEPLLLKEGSVSKMFTAR